MELQRLNAELAEHIFGKEVRPHLLHEAVMMQQNNRRAGTASTKTRGQVSGGGKKPWRQKGTGRARAGSIRSPIWTGGARIFGPAPRDYGYRMPKKARRQALLSALSLKNKEGKVIVIEDFAFPEIKTKQMVDFLGALEVEQALVVIPASDRAVELSARNLPRAKVIRAEGLNVYDLLRFEHLVLTRSALGKLEERFAQ